MRSAATASAFERELSACRNWLIRSHVEERQSEYDADYRATINAIGTLTPDAQRRAARAMQSLGGPMARSGSEGWSLAVDALRTLGVPGWRLYPWDRREIAARYLQQMEIAA